jgi:Protein of unknown function (DUF2480)
MSDEIKNRVAESGLITIDLEEWIQDVTFVSFDLMPLLWQGQVLREKDLREYLKSQSSDFYSGQVIFMPIPSDVILPQWTHLLVGSHFGQHCSAFFVGSEDQAKSSYLMKLIQEMDPQLFQDRMVIIKGCTQRFITAEVQNALMMKILPVVKSLMFGEPCSTVPLYKRKA